MSLHTASLPSRRLPNGTHIGSERRAQGIENNNRELMSSVRDAASPDTLPVQQPADSTDPVVNSRLSPRFQVGGRLRSRHRRRAPTACQLCRIRKTKCDNGRPSCGYCLFQGARCLYTDKGSSPKAISPPAASLDPATQGDVSNAVLLERIGHLTALVEEIHGDATLRSQHDGPYTIANSHLPPSTEPLRIIDQTLDDGAGPISGSAFADDGFGKLEVTELAARTSSCESLLRWPILHNTEQIGDITSFALQSAINTELPVEAVLASARFAVQEDKIWPLCRKFLVLIHVKNPILEVAEFKRYAREAAECGPSWDGRGCLVVSTTLTPCRYQSVLITMVRSCSHALWPAWHLHMSPRSIRTRMKRPTAQQMTSPRATTILLPLCVDWACYRLH